MKRKLLRIATIVLAIILLAGVVCIFVMPNIIGEEADNTKKTPSQNETEQFNEEETAALTEETVFTDEIETFGEVSIDDIESYEEETEPKEKVDTITEPTTEPATEPATEPVTEQPEVDETIPVIEPGEGDASWGGGESGL